jgi:hypothetical protein
MKRKIEIEKEKPKSISCNKPFNIERHGLRGGAHSGHGPSLRYEADPGSFQAEIENCICKVGYFNVV